MEPEPGGANAATLGASIKHTGLEDVQAYVAGSLLFAFAIAITSASGLLTGGTSGVALLGHYATGISFGRVLFVANIPFYVLAVRKLGWRFTRRTFLSVALVTGLSELMPHVVQFERIDPFFAAVTGGLMAGTAVLILFRTIPLFWIPAHTFTFLLPPELRILFAAFLSVALGAILAFAKRRGAAEKRTGVGA